MRYTGKIYRPPSEAYSFILQATLGCSWNHCTYCDMYHDKEFRVRQLDQVLEDIQLASKQLGSATSKVFVADGDSLVMGLEHWIPILEACRAAFPALRQVSAYATARNILDKTPEELSRLRESGLSMLYIGPESGDEQTLQRIAKGASFQDHVEAARKAHAAGIRLSVIFLLGAGGTERSREHASASAALATAMDPEYLAALTLTVIPGTPIHRLQSSNRFVLPDVHGLLEELRIFVAEASPTDAVFRTNHASNYVPIKGRLPRDRQRMLAVLDAALQGRIPLRPEWSRGL